MGIGLGPVVAPPGSSMGRPALLISTGEPTDAFTLSRLASHEGLSVITDTSARVVELAVRYRPAIIILDVQQMGGEGLQLLAELRQNAATRHARVIATSAVDDEFARTTALELGALAFAVKPFDDGFIRSIATLARGNVAA